MREQYGRPLQFLARLLGGWILLRVVMLMLPLFWQRATPIAGPRLASDRFGPLSDTRFHGPLRDWGGPSPRAVAAPPDRAVLAQGVPRPREVLATLPEAHRPAQGVHGDDGMVMGWNNGAADELPGMSLAFAQPRQGPSALEASARDPGQSILPDEPMRLAQPAASRQDRWSAVTWLLWRPDSHVHFAQEPLLGGSQAGLRIDYRLLGAGVRSLSVYGRLSRALERPNAEEAALGLALRPLKALPVAIMVERRQKLGEGGRSGFAVLAAGGVGPSEIARRVELEGYGEAGLVGMPGSDGFADGRLALGYRLTPGDARADVAVGASLSGSAQNGAQRLDFGPELRLRLPVGRAHLRLSIEWRQRIWGDARPQSGPAVALVADF